MNEEFKGRKKLGEWKGYDLFVDWNYVLRENGKRELTEKAELILGNFLKFSSIIAIIIVLLLKISIGEFLFLITEPSSSLDLIWWVSLLIMFYSFYLTRDLEKFSDTLAHSSIETLKAQIKGKKISEIELTHYFDHDLLDELDEIISVKPVDYLKRIVFELAEHSSVSNLITRLGTTPQQLLKLDFNKIELLLSDFDDFINNLIKRSFQIAVENDFQYVDERAMLLSLFQNELRDLLLEIEVSDDEINGVIMWIKNQEKKKHYYNLWKFKSSLKPTSVVNRAYTSGFAGTLNEFSRDFTVGAIKGDFVLSLAREAELENLIDLLTEGEGQSILLVGEPGVGKTTLIKSLALRMVVEDVPKNIRDMRLVGFDISKASAASRNLDVFKSKVQKVFEDTAKAKNIILVMEDISQILAMRDDSGDEIISIMVDAIDRYKLRLIITSTNETYVKYLKSRTGLMTYLNIIKLDEPSVQTTQQIIIDRIPHLEYEYKTKVSFDAIKKVVELSNEAFADKSQPQKSIDILEEAIAKAAKREDGIVTEADIENLVSTKIGVKVGKITKNEGELLENLEKELHKRVVGQDTAINAVSSALRRSRAGLSSTNRPVASFLFFGPTGVGKTETAKTIAEVYYGDEKLMHRIDMSEYHEGENLKRLIGYADGERFEGGFLTEPVREHPFSLLLLDEIEKANPKVLDLFLQILDDGFITDGLGRKVDFTNTIIIATSNASSKFIAEEVEKGKDYEEVYNSLIPKLRETFKVEFLNRFDKIVMYKPLMKDEILMIAEIMMKKESQKLKEKGIELTYSKKVLDELAVLGYDPVYGARELRRVVQDQVEDGLADLIIKKELKSGSKYHLESLSQFS